MNNVETIILTGIAIGNETATVALCPRKCNDDGVDIVASVKVLEYTFHVETFFYGYNIENFLKGVSECVSGKVNVARLINYNETLVLEFITEGGAYFLSLAYKSVLPKRPEDGILRILHEASNFEVKNNVGSRFSFAFMPLHNNISEVAAWLASILANHNISRINPYP